MWRGGYDAIGYRPGCFSEIAGIPAITKLGDFPAKDFKKYSRWPRGTVGGCQGRLPAYHRASSKGNNLDLTSSQRRIMCDERKEKSLNLTSFIYGN